MRILLRHTETGLFFQAPNQWTQSVDHAYDFLMIDCALEYVGSWKFKQVELAFVFDDPAWVTTVPLQRSALQYAAA